MPYYVENSITKTVTAPVKTMKEANDLADDLNRRCNNRIFNVLYKETIMSPLIDKLTDYVSNDEATRVSRELIMKFPNIGEPINITKGAAGLTVSFMDHDKMLFHYIPNIELDKFWMCYVIGGSTPSVGHNSYSKALKEAERLANATGKTTYVMQATDRFEKSVVNRTKL